MNVNELIAKRWSPKIFLDKPVENDKLKILFEATRWAASSMNEQPWRFIVCEKSNTKAYRQMLEVLMEGNQSWAKTAPVLICVVAKCKFEHKNRDNKHAFYDTGQAVATFTLQAAGLDLYVRQMGGFYPDKTREYFKIPESFEPVVVLALGYADQAAKPERVRMEKHAWVFHECFGESRNF